jgi:hypothetical protein
MFVMMLCFVFFDTIGQDPLQKGVMYLDDLFANFYIEVELWPNNMRLKNQGAIGNGLGNTSGTKKTKKSPPTLCQIQFLKN